MSFRIIFDIDGTLTRTFHSDDDTYLRALDTVVSLPKGYHYGAECPNLTDSGVLDFATRKFLGRGPTQGEIEGMQADYLLLLRQKVVTHPDNFSEIPGALELIKQLKERQDCQIAVATGNWNQIAEFKLRHIGLPVDEMIIQGCDEHHAKEDFLGSLVNVLDEQWKPDQAWYVGDSSLDSRAAQANAMRFIGVDFRQKGGLAEEPNDLIVKNLNDERLSALWKKV